VGWPNPNLAKQSPVFHTMCRHAGFRWGGRHGGKLSRGSGVCGTGPVRENGSVGLCGLFCVFPLSISLWFLFPLFAVLLNCPYPDPPVSACLFPFSSAPWRGEGRPRGAFVAGSSPNQNTVSKALLKARYTIFTDLHSSTRVVISL